MGYPTLTDIKSYLGITTPADDAYLTLVLAAVIQAVEEYCQRAFPEAEVFQTLVHVDDTDTFLLKHYPVSAVSLVVANGTTFGESDYTLDGDLGLLYLTISRSGDFEFTYTGGYDPIPPMVDYVIKEAVKTVYSNRDTDSELGPIKSERVDGATTLAYFAPEDYVSSGGGSSLTPKILSPYANLLDTFRSERAFGVFG